jgi:hypothetical protein
MLKIRYQKLTPDRLQIMLNEISQLDFLSLGQVLETFQQQLTTVCEHRFLYLSFHAS